VAVRKYVLPSAAQRITGIEVALLLLFEKTRTQRYASGSDE